MVSRSLTYFKCLSQMNKKLLNWCKIIDMPRCSGNKTAFIILSPRFKSSFKKSPTFRKPKTLKQTFSSNGGNRFSVCHRKSRSRNLFSVSHRKSLFLTGIDAFAETCVRCETLDAVAKGPKNICPIFLVASDLFRTRCLRLY